ncbi:Ribosome biogenesis protein Nop16 [Neonectria magnoliae]|uniref:Nucleolar protein 16 n=1 Tax=Neonectria magnoliae TaxID=2732573 RepID=A0ABR1HXY3_9HYPO
MGRELQKKKRRSGRAPVRTSNRNNKKILNPRGNSVIAKNWNKDETLSQNYRRLGLVARLKAPTGGVEKRLGAAGAVTTRTSASDPFAITTIENAIVSEARVERDADGKIVRILGRSKPNPLNDLLNDIDEDSDTEVNDAAATDEWTGIEDDPDTTHVVKSLIEESRNPAEKTPRHQSSREREWLDRLIAKHGDDTAAMAKDRRLNPMQQTAPDIAKRIRKLSKA